MEGAKWSLVIMPVSDNCQVSPRIRTVKIAITACVLLLLAASTTAQKSAGTSKSQPTFRQYPAVADFKGEPAKPNLDPDLYIWRTQIRTQARKGPNFAGHFTLAKWGCGAPCVKFVIIDARSGTVYDPDITVGCSDKNGGGIEVQFKLTSRLLVTTGFSEKFGCGTDFYEWDGKQLNFLHFEPSPIQDEDDPSANSAPKAVQILS